MKKFSRIDLRLLTVLALSASTIWGSTANAASINPHAYVQAYIQPSGGLSGVYMSITNDQEDLSHVGGSSFINKEMWMAFSNSQWIEAGTTRGPIDSSSGYISDWHGHFMAWNDDSTNDYHERNFQNEYPTGTHNFQISRDSGTWTVYMDFTQVATVPHFDSFTTAIAHQVGIESNDNSNSFVSGTYASALEYRNTSGSWVLWNNTSIYDGTNQAGKDMGWSLAYSSTNNRLTFNDN